MPLHELIRQQKFQEIYTLVNSQNTDKKTLVNEPLGVFRYTPLHVAATCGQIDAIRFLLMHGASISTKDANGDTAFDHALYNNQLGTANMLLNHGADIHALNKDNKTALERGLIMRNVERCKWLLKQGAGIGFEFGHAVKPDFLAQITKDMIVIGATKDSKPVTRSTPGFEHAITNLDELKKAILDKQPFDLDTLSKTIKQLKTSSKYNDNPAVNELSIYIKILRDKNVPSLKKQTIRFLFKNQSILQKQPVQLPEELTVKLQKYKTKHSIALT